MGYKIAEEAHKRKHIVTLISGPTKLTPPKVHRFISIERAEELLGCLKKEIKIADCLIMSAAVSDFKPKHICKKKIKREKNLKLNLAPTKDILSELIGKDEREKLFVGFSLETENIVKNAHLKLKNKDLDLIVANRLTKEHNPFGDKELDVCIIDKKGAKTQIKSKDKAFIARLLLDKIEEMWYLKENRGQRTDDRKKRIYAY